MKLLILGGTVFLGRAIGEAALAAGHDVSTFTRGRSGTPLFGARNRIGDRDNRADLRTLAKESWDAVVDICRMSPDQVERSTAILGNCTSHYIYVSSTSVYADRSQAVDEESVVYSPDDDESETGQYPHLKVRCEEIVRRNCSVSNCIVRPGLLAGPGDESDRFTYWVRRAAQPGPILAPGRPQRRVRFTDVRDLATWMVAIAALRICGTYNVDGPAEPGITMAEVIASCQRIAGNLEPVHWVEDKVLLAEELNPYVDVPLWVPEEEEYKAFAEVDSSRAVKGGMRFRAVDDTVRSVAEWAKRHRTGDLVAGISRARERELLQRLGAI